MIERIVCGDERVDDRHRTRCCECENALFVFRNVTTSEVTPFGERPDRSENRCVTVISCKVMARDRNYGYDHCRKEILDGEWLPEGTATWDGYTGSLPRGCPSYSEVDSQKCQGARMGHVPPSGTCRKFIRKRMKAATARMDDTRTTALDRDLRAAV